MKDIKKLIQELKDPNKKRGDVEETLAAMGRSAVPVLIEALNDQNDEVRRSVAWVLGEIGDSTAVPALIEALKDKDGYVRGWAAWALGKIKDASTVPALIEVLKDEDGDVREYAACALGTIGVNAEQLQTLMRMIKEGKMSDERGSAAETIYWLIERHPTSEWKAVVSALIDALKDNNGMVREWAASALSCIAENHRRSDWKAAVCALIEIMEERHGFWRVPAAGALGKIGDNLAVPMLTEALKDEDCDLRCSAAEALGKIDRSNEQFEIIVQMLRSGNPDERDGAVRAVGQIGYVSAVPALIDALKDENVEVRRSAADALGNIFKKCESIEQLGECQKQLEEGMKKLLKNYHGRVMEVPPDIQFKFANLMIEAAKRKNRLAPSRDILLDDIPKPPNGGKVYQSIRLQKMKL